jgi:hypothetical protein
LWATRMVFQKSSIRKSMSVSDVRREMAPDRREIQIDCRGLTTARSLGRSAWRLSAITPSQTGHGRYYRRTPTVVFVHAPGGRFVH